MNSPAAMNIRAASKDDLTTVFAIERAAQTAAHWRPEDYSEIFHRDAPKRILLVAESDGNIVGFVVGHLIGPECELENIAVAGQHRGRGIGQKLTLALVEIARHRGAETVFLEVRESNTAARSLYERCGFERCGRRPAYYSEPREDALLYRFLCRPE